MKRKYEKITRFFNLIEVTLALAVVGIGIAGIMSLFPVALEASRDAIAENYAADAGEQFLGYIANNWTTVTGLPTSAQTINDTDTNTTWSKSVSEKVDPLDKSSNIYDDTTDGTNITGVYGIKQGNSDGSQIDFIAHIKIWKSQISNVYWNSTTSSAGSSTLPYTEAARVNVEISWPVGKPYSTRTKRYYSLEVYNPN